MKSGNTFAPTGREITVPESTTDLGDFDAHSRYQKMFEMAEAKLKDLNSAVKMIKPENADFMKRLSAISFDDI